MALPCMVIENRTWLNACPVFIWERMTEMNLVFVLNSILLGVGLAMDAFSVSLANGLNEPEMRKRKMCLVAGVFGGFQALMPMLGWVCVHTIVEYFHAFSKLIPWIALALLGYIGGKMLYDGLKGGDAGEEKPAVGAWALIVQGVATSIDALSVGFTIADYNVWMALAAAVIISVVTFAICIVGLILGKKFGTKLAGKATILGGVILIAIGIEIFISGIL